MSTPASDATERQATVTLWGDAAAGGLFLTLGLFYLLVRAANVGMPQIANLHRLFIRMTFASVGAIFSAAGWRHGNGLRQRSS